MREQLYLLQHLMTHRRLDTTAVSAALDQLPIDAGVEIAAVVEQARRSIAALTKGDHRYRPLLRHAIARLVVLVERRDVASHASEFKTVFRNANEF